MFEGLYTEFGEENVHRVRRELTARKGRTPSYIELLAELCLRQGPSDKSLEPTQADGAVADGAAGTVRR